MEGVDDVDKIAALDLPHPRRSTSSLGIMSRHVAVMLALVTAAFVPVSRSDEPILSTLCSISASPKKYDGLLVRVHARVMSDGLEHTVLVDVAPKCRFGGAALSVASDKDPDIERITSTIFSGRRPGTTNKFIRGDFIGVFRLTPNVPPMREIEVHSVSNLKITFFGDERR
jgi:hypothetical protein